MYPPLRMEPIFGQFSPRKRLVFERAYLYRLSKRARFFARWGRKGVGSRVDSSLEVRLAKLER